ncbi:MAG TPA: hypothetical protein VGN32_03670, partial [Ktedonobacterales bacterium]|jgi:hypothetical protein|nr:hypothetical protein [Ktedonobacterales bacterium]
LIDGRNLFDPRELARLGFHARGIGRPGDQSAAAAGLNGHHAPTLASPRPAAEGATNAGRRAVRARQNGKR